ncbi:hypothetical protein BH09ACT4_BH09ACT4_25600 [soil metagenome]
MTEEANSQTVSRQLGFATDLPDLPESFYFDELPSEDLKGWEG